MPTTLAQLIAAIQAYVNTYIFANNEGKITGPILNTVIVTVATMVATFFYTYYAPLNGPTFTGAVTMSPPLSALSGGTGNSAGNTSKIQASALGVVCDGSTDTTAALQTAITNLQGHSYTLQLPDSVCRTTAPLAVTGSINLQGSSEFGSTLYLDTATAGSDIIDVSSAANFNISTMTFVRKQADPTGWVVSAANSGNTYISHVYVYGNNKIGNGFKNVNYNNVKIDDAFIQNLTGECYYISGGSTSITGSVGFINTLGTITGGSGYTNGTYFTRSLTGGTGSGEVATITVSGGSVTSVALTYAGAGGYTVGDTLSVPAANIGGTGSGFSVPVASTAITSADFRLSGQSRCDGGQYGIVEGDWAGGVYVNNNIFYNISNIGFIETSTNYDRVGGSQHFWSNDWDTIPTDMSFASAFDVQIEGNRFSGANATNVINVNQSNQLTVTGNTFYNNGATVCLNLGANDGVHLATGVTVTGNTFASCSYAVSPRNGANNVVIDGNIMINQASYAIDLTACNLVRISVGINTIDSSGSNGPYQYNCAGDDIQFGGVGGTKRLGQLRAANMNTTADQAIPISTQITAFQITGIEVTNCSTSITTAAGGFYPAASKGGTAIVAASQTYSAATSASVVVSPTIATTPLATRYAQTSIYFSLTTPQGAASTCDIYVDGKDLS